MGGLSYGKSTWKISDVLRDIEFVKPFDRCGHYFSFWLLGFRSFDHFCVGAFGSSFRSDLEFSFFVRFRPFLIIRSLAICLIRLSSPGSNICFYVIILFITIIVFVVVERPSVVSWDNESCLGSVTIIIISSALAVTSNMALLATVKTSDISSFPRSIPLLSILEVPILEVLARLTLKVPRFEIIPGLRLGRKCCS